MSGWGEDKMRGLPHCPAWFHLPFSSAMKRNLDSLSGSDKQGVFSAPQHFHWQSGYRLGMAVSEIEVKGTIEFELVILKYDCLMCQALPGHSAT